MLPFRVMPYGRYICWLPARSLVALCGSRHSRGEIHRPHFPEAPGRLSRTVDVPLQIPVACYDPSTRESGWLLGFRVPGLRSGAAGIDIEAMIRYVSIPIPTASGLLLHVASV